MPFDEIIGHRRCIDMLRRGLERDRLPHAMLFCGPDGVGKRLVARHLAAGLNCRERRQDGGCGHCKNCRLILGDQHPDIVTLQPDGNFIRMEAVRAMIQEAAVVPFYADFKVFILEKAHAMKVETANALLKILEEPLPFSKLILISHHPDALLQTIRSRCQLFRFAPLRVEEVVAILQKTGGFTAEEALQRARRAEGRISRASGIDLRAKEDMEDYARRFLQAALANEPFSEVARMLERMLGDKRLLNLSQYAARNSDSALETEISASSQAVAISREWLSEFLHALRDRLADQIGGGAGESMDMRPWLDIAREAGELCRRLDHNIRCPIALENFFLTCRAIAGGKSES